MQATTRNGQEATEKSSAEEGALQGGRGKTIVRPPMPLGACLHEKIKAGEESVLVVSCQ